MFRPAAILVIGFTIFLAVFAARVSGKTMIKTIQQTDLEGMLSLTKDMTNKYPDWNQTTPACNWTGVTCNAGPTGPFVQTILWNSRGLGGTPNFATLPVGLQFLYMHTNQLVGTPNLGSLNSELLMLALYQNDFTGTPNLCCLNEKLQELYLYSNSFTGEPDLSRLNTGLHQLDISDNQFTGTPKLDTLPDGLLLMLLEVNNFTGTPDLTKLNKNLQALRLDRNQFTGTPDLTLLPQGDGTFANPGLLGLFLNGNQFTGTPNLSKLPPMLENLPLFDNRFQGNGSFPPNVVPPNGPAPASGPVWCDRCRCPEQCPPCNVQSNMCGAGKDGTFDCGVTTGKGLWHC